VKINTAEWANSAAAEDPLPIDSPPFQEWASYTIQKIW
jgi:hypothetical protein